MKRQTNKSVAIEDQRFRQRIFKKAFKYENKIFFYKIYPLK